MMLLAGIGIALWPSWTSAPFWHTATLTLDVATQSILPQMVIGLPRLYGAWHHVMTGFMKHAGLAENVLDHRLNSRTVYVNPVSRFIYWNMNYHVEHHMFPMVPFHCLPEQHEKIKRDLLAPNTSILDAYREIWTALKRQLRHEDFLVRRELPGSARPYREDLHAAALDVPAT